MSKEVMMRIPKCYAPFSAQCYRTIIDEYPLIKTYQDYLDARVWRLFILGKHPHQEGWDIGKEE